MRSHELPEWQTLLEVISLLNKLGIPYMLTGSLAKTFYATPRMTRDIDIVVELEASDVTSVVTGFEGSFYIDKDAVYSAIKESRMFNILHLRFHVKVDLIVRKVDEYRKVEFSRRRELTLNGIKCWVVSPEDLILSKLWWAKDSLSDLQLSDVKDLMMSVQLDHAYIENWVKKLSLEHVYGMVKK